MRKINVAVDGTSGVGKSTVCDRLAKKYHMQHLDTGAMYRCVALAAYQNDISPDDVPGMEKLLDTIEITFNEDNEPLLNGQNVTREIRTNTISNLAARVSALPVVRKKMVALQRRAVEKKGFIVDGRDICTVVLPDAEAKIFMSASPRARATRRYEEYIGKGLEADYETIYQDIVARDYMDSHRECSPLVKAADAVEVDTSDLNIEEVVEEMSRIIDEAL